MLNSTLEDNRTSFKGLNISRSFDVPGETYYLDPLIGRGVVAPRGGKMLSHFARIRMKQPPYSDDQSRTALESPPPPSRSKRQRQRFGLSHRCAPVYARW